ncbi:MULTISPECIES: helix-turn-helix transcriptional regulator [unclassified Streptomyces]|uniref:helix-turn-helix domain-containing protein n=1 Tax=unclassified Streptomyces TaxID=2593676 RepID=UPI000CD4A57C|nr:MULTISPECIES: helix-turn-helix transcriptional regulator [unclassified Streptomyces]AWL39830.1 XRE family transcriptional regulator [Streptomyces sp. SM18]
MARGLKAARAARGWSQDRLVYEMRRVAEQRLLDIASAASLKTYISEWENGRRVMSDRYASLLRPLLGVTDDELRGTGSALELHTDGYADLLTRIDAAGSLSESMVPSFLAQTELLRSMDRQMGATGLVDQMNGHLEAMEEALTFAVLPGMRRPIATALAGASTLAAWQALDAGAVDRAWRRYELAKKAAQDAESPLYLAHAMGEQAYVLADAGRPQLAIELVRDAQRAPERQSLRLRAWLAAAEAELCAGAGVGRESEARAALDRATALLPDDGEVRDVDMLSIFLDTGHLARWRGNVLAKLGDPSAMEELYASLASADASFVRATSGLHCDLTQAHLARGELEEARSHLQQARLLANRTGSVRYRRRVEMLTGRL